MGGKGEDGVDGARNKARGGCTDGREEFGGFEGTCEEGKSHKVIVLRARGILNLEEFSFDSGAGSRRLRQQGTKYGVFRMRNHRYGLGDGS